MKNWRFALTRRWFTYLGMAVVFAVACVLLSHWQIGRNNETVIANKLVTRNYSAPAAPVSELLGSSDSFAAGDIWRPVAMDGHYLTGKQILVRNRSYGSNPGYEVLTPFKLTDGSVFIVDRGWVPVGGKQDYPDVVPAAPTGTEHVIARLQASEPILPGRNAPKGQVAEINLPTVASMIDEKAYTGAYGLLSKETPAPPDRPIAAAKPSLDPGPFLSYAFQWLLFAVFGFGGLAWALRQEYRIRNADDPEERVRAAERDRKARRKAPNDSDIEDAILDSR
jgi:cytochrome oxidase assembly protein ShyY1